MSENRFERLISGDAAEYLRKLEAESVLTCITSPPYFGLQDYEAEGQISLEATPQEYLERLVLTFREVRRVLRKDGTLWIVIGDSYCRKNCGGLKNKDLMGLPWALAFCSAAGRLVSVSGHRLAQAQRHAGGCGGPLHPEP